MSKLIKTKVDIADYSREYADLVSFHTSNKFQPVHRWYPFVEGFSSELVRRIIGEQEAFPKTILDPFGGVGTTSLTSQNLGVKCHSIESNPFFYDVARAKLRTDYDPKIFLYLIEQFTLYLKSRRARPRRPVLESKTFFEAKGLDKWIFDEAVTNGILDIVNYIQKLEDEEHHRKYCMLFKIAVASIFLPVSNVFRNGKCLSYRKKWKETQINRKQVHALFLEICKDKIYIDINSLQKAKPFIHNFLHCANGDSRIEMKKVDDSSVDLIITSPPYLNSRDYTDVYRLELWMLGYVKKFTSEQLIRKSALTSHVQISLPEFTFPNNHRLEIFLDHLNSLNGGLWNKNIPNMIKGYFSEMKELLSNFYRMLTPGGKVYLNVSNSAYGGEICEVDMIIAEIAQTVGFKIKELRVARFTKSSGQQNLHGKLRESVTIMQK